jgi:voltage-gated potassium channel
MPPLLSSPLRNLLAGVFVLFLISAVATAAYMWQGWPLGDAIYMVVITVFSVGYGEIAPVNTPGLRATTILLIVAGCTDMVFLTGSLVQLITASQFQQFFGTRRMQKDIGRLSGHVIVCGFGRIGQMLARELRAARAEFVVLDNVEQQAQLARASDYMFLHGDARDEDVLKQAGIVRAGALATVLPDDAANVFITLSARSLNPNLTIIARGELPSTENKLLQAGADRVVLPARIGAERMAEMLIFKDVSTIVSGIMAGGLDKLAADLHHLGLGIEVAAVESGSRCAGMTISQVETQAAGAFLIVALEREDGQTILQPHGEVTVNAGDGLAIVGRPGLARASELLFAAPRAFDEAVS